MADDVEYYETTRKNLLREIREQGDVGPTPEIGNLKIERVLDIGCGIGQALFPLAVKRGAIGVGVDVSEYSLGIGRRVYDEHLPTARITFLKAPAESLPFASDSFDLINCGLALPYTHNAKALAEIERVLRPGGVFLLKIHHVRYYLLKLKQGLAGADLLSMIHCGRVLTSGAIYHLSGHQPMTRILNETFQTRWLLKRELADKGMSIDSEIKDAPAAAPAFVIRKNILGGGVPLKRSQKKGGRRSVRHSIA